MKLSEVNIKEGYPFEHHGKSAAVHVTAALFLQLQIVFKTEQYMSVLNGKNKIVTIYNI